MEKITSVTWLKNAIQILEAEQASKGQLLKDQLYITTNHFKPSSLMGSTFKEMISSPSMVEAVIVNTVALASGYITRKIVVGASGNLLRRFLGTLLQAGITKLVSNQTDNAKSTGKPAIRSIIRKKKANADTQ